MANEEDMTDSYETKMPLKTEYDFSDKMVYMASNFIQP